MKYFLLSLLLIALANARSPNIVLIISDDHSYTDYGFMGHPHIETPNLDKLSSESALFRRGYVPTALCRPALITLITGLYAHQHKISGNSVVSTPQNKDYSKKLGKNFNFYKLGKLPTWLSQKGYVSFQSGKWWEGHYKRGGFTEGMTVGGRHGGNGLKIGRKGMKPVFDFIDQSVRDEKPFFVWYAPYLPHTPHNPPDRLYEKYKSKDLPDGFVKYYSMCEWLDETCGALINYIDDLGLTKDTLFIYVADNGWIQNPGIGYASRSKRTPYEGGVRTPIMFRWKGTIQPKDRNELCSSIDIVPTILSAADVDFSDSLPGLNLLPQLKSGEKINRNALFGESFAHDIADFRNPQASLLFRWVIQGHYKLILSYDGIPGRMKKVNMPKGNGPELFDLENDPNEKVNLAGQYPNITNQLSELLNEWYIADQRKVGEAYKPAFK